MTAIQGTGRRSYRYRWLRRPRHIGVERFLAAFRLRGAKVPPDSWDDLKRCVERSWKAHRGTQWRDG